MIAFVGATRAENISNPGPSAFEPLLPSIERFAWYAFRKIQPSRRADLVAEVIANAYVAFVRLVKRGLAALVYPTALAKFAVKQVRDGRRVGNRRTARDVMSEYAQARRALVVESLEQIKFKPPWEEQLLADRHATPAELVACKLDFRAWLGRLSALKRQVALRLAAGDTTQEAARHFQVSQARISQLRRELRANWEAFQMIPSAA